MGTNYYRIPTEEELEQRKEKLLSRIYTMPMTAASVENGFRYIDDPKDEWSSLNPWNEFVEDTNIHLGKRSMGWKFCWNFHENKYYSSKQELIDFVLSGRVVDEYGDEIDSQEFLDMAFNWNPDGAMVNADYYASNERSSMFNDPKYYDRIIDGLRVSTSTEFS